MLTKWTVSTSEAGNKLLPFLRRRLGSRWSARKIKQGVDRNCCKVNGDVERFGSVVLREGDVIVFDEQELQRLVMWDFVVEDKRILYEDQYFVVYNKSAGMICDDPRVWQNLRERWFDACLVHRLDRETSGVWLIAKDGDCAKALEDLFRQRRIEKEYLAIVDGVPRKRSGIVTNRLMKLDSGSGVVRWGQAPKKGQGVVASTSWFCEKSGNGVSLLRCQPHTGRTHQIRVHLSGLGLPILGDYQYCRSFKSPYRPKRLLLHAYQIAFPHPMTKEAVIVKAPCPADFKQALRKHRL